jgi:hypothetical protein
MRRISVSIRPARRPRDRPLRRGVGGRSPCRPARGRASSGRRRRYCHSRDTS